MDLDDVDQFVKLFVDLLDNQLVSSRDQRYTGDQRIRGRGNTEALYVIAPTAKHACNSGEYPWLVVH
jgi:hypothetical protein